MEAKKQFLPILFYLRSFTNDETALAYSHRIPQTKGVSFRLEVRKYRL